MNQADQDAGNKAVDSLINYETVKVHVRALCYPCVCRGAINSSETAPYVVDH